MNIEQGLKALREADSGASASGDLELRLRAAFREHHVREHSRLRALVIGAIAASLIFAAAIRLKQPAAVDAPEAPAIAAKHSTQPKLSRDRQGAEVNSRPTVIAKAKPAPRRHARKKLPVEVPQREVATDFIPIPYTPAMTPYDRGQVIRVNMPASSMRSFGLPVSEERIFERVRADVLMGEDGIARAIRFVR